jgi:hypothetical protein
LKLDEILVYSYHQRQDYLLIHKKGFQHIKIMGDAIDQKTQGIDGFDDRNAH